MSGFRVVAPCMAAAVVLLACASESARVTPPKPGPGFPDSGSFYPQEALRNRQEGTTTVHVCVNHHGRLTDAPSVAESSGTPALDAAAIEVATAGNGHYLAATQNGFVTSGCGIFRVKFALPPQTEAPH
jgi:TonB family protein